MSAHPHHEVAPVVVPVRRESVVTVRPRFEHAGFADGRQVALRVVPDDGRGRDGARLADGACESVPFTLDATGTMRFRHFFGDEQEYTFCLTRLDPESGQEKGPRRFFGIYALEADLLRLRPFRGDVHMHSSRSDGAQAPVYVAAAARRAGMDFMALTDHRRYQPSLELIAALEGPAPDLRCFPGEEVHEPEGIMHVVNFGGRESVTALLGSEAARQEIAGLARQWPELDAASRSAVAHTVWACRAIRAAGGVAIYAHPWWRPQHRLHFPPAAHRAVMAARPFDAVEVFSGFGRAEWESNALSLLDYHEACRNGRPLAAVAVSDSHNCDSELFGAFHTIVLAASPEFDDLAEAIRAGRSVAAEAVRGEFPRLCGPLRLARFVYFLLREYFPWHDAICRAEGELLLAHFGGDPAAARLPALRQGRVAALQRRLWGEERREEAPAADAEEKQGAVV
jgi:predicted metal-dependent phosphoesterase TrpH